MLQDLREDVQSVIDKVMARIKELLNGKSMSDADLMAVLEEKAKGTKLNWKESVIDFLTLLEINSSKENRIALAKELGLAPELKIGTAKGNEALRVAVFKKLQENGGNVPQSLID